MTIAELSRVFESKARVIKIEERKKASYDYILADLIGRSMSRVYNSNNKMPPLNEVYPTLFNEEETEEKAQEAKDNVSAIRFKLFAQSYNSKINKEVGKEE